MRRWDVDNPNFIPLAGIADWVNENRVPALVALARMVEKAVMGEPFEDTNTEAQDEDTYAPISA
jgi:hypothetical protein